MKFVPKIAVAAAIAAVALVLTGCTGGSGATTGGANAQAKGGTLTIGAVQDVASFDPAKAHIGHPVPYYQAVYDSLLRHKPDGTLVPMLATKWVYNANKTVLTLTLHQGVQFTDGSPVNAAAVKVNLDRFRTGNGPDASTLSLVSAVDVKDTSTVAITLSAPDPSLVDNLANEVGFIASPKAIDGGKIATNPVGSGPYILDASATVAGSKYTFVKNPHYWDPSLQVYDTIVMKPITDSTAMLNSLLSGQVNAAYLNAKTSQQAANAGMTEYKYQRGWLGLLIFDRDGTMVPALKDVRVRQAINLALDKDTLLAQVQKGSGTVTSQMFGSSTSGYQPSLDKTYSYSLDKAKKLMSDAGYSKGFGVSMPMTSTIDPALVAGVTQGLADIGITVNWQNVAPSDYTAGLIKGKWPMAEFQIVQGSAWYTTTLEILPNATYNPFHTNTSTVEALAHSLQYGNEAEQASAAKQLNTYLVEQAWFVPFYRPDNILFTDKNTVTTPQEQQAVPSIYNYTPKK